MRCNVVVSVVSVVFFVLAAAGCPRPLPDAPPPPVDQPGVPGTLGGRCATGGFCNGDLVCVDDVCEVGPNEGEGEGTGEGEGEGAGEGEGEDAGEGEGEGEPACAVDRDQDGSCDGVDCDDNDFNRSPDNRERCSPVDEDCDGDNNDGLDCTFVAHTADTLFKIDPFEETFSVFRSVQLGGNGSILDIDIDEDGRLLAATAEGIFEIGDDGRLTTVANVRAPNRTNGICITGTNTMFLTNDDGAASAAWRVEGNQIVEVGGFSQGLVSSGDCVVTKEEDVLMSAKDPDEPTATDLLVLVNSTTGATTTVGDIGFSRVFGLSASFGFLYGVTSTGQVIEIDRDDGTGTLLFTANNVTFFGAANGD